MQSERDALRVSTFAPHWQRVLELAVPGGILHTDAVSDQRKHKGWHSRGFLPHLDAAEIQQAITFRLADALPKQVVDGWKRELSMNGSREDDAS